MWVNLILPSNISAWSHKWRCRQERPMSALPRKRTSRACLDLSTLCPNRVLMHCSKIALYSITSSARGGTNGGTSILPPIREDRSTLPIENQSFVNSGEGVYPCIFFSRI